MATPRQLRANRANAAHSTGPRSDAGRARAAANATRHGLTAAPDPAEVACLARALLADVRGDASGAAEAAPEALPDLADPLQALALQLAGVELRLARIRAHLDRIDARLAAAIAVGQLDGAASERGRAVLADLLGIFDNPCAAARAEALAKLVVRGDPALLDPVVRNQRARRVALRYRREAEAARRRLLAEWAHLTAPPEPIRISRNEAIFNREEKLAATVPDG